MIMAEGDGLKAGRDGDLGGFYPIRQLRQVKFQESGLHLGLPLRVKQVLCRAKLV